MKKHTYKIYAKTYMANDFGEILPTLMTTKQVDIFSIKAKNTYNFHFKFKGTEEELKEFLPRLLSANRLVIRKTKKVLF